MFRLIAKIALLFVFFVIMAGSVVRMTGSGMGCPDWPKCFGHLIPPTERSQIEWHPGEQFHEGQLIIHNESLQKAVSDFTAGDTYNADNWAPYTKHDYAEFNAFHTWTEFINRLFGMLSGIGVFIMAIVGTYLALFKYKNYKKRIIGVSWITVCFLGLAAWLGAVVVYSMLQPFKITMHMGVSIFILAGILYLIHLTKTHRKPRIYNKQFRTLVIISLILTLSQIVLGTRVRQYVDEQIKIFGQFATSQWMADPTISFYIHRSYSIIIVALNAFLWWKNDQLNLGYTKMNVVLGLIVLEVIIGISLYYFDFPFLTQPIHLLVALLLFCVQFYILLETKKNQPKLMTSKSAQ